MDEGTQGGSQLALVTGGGRGIGAAICKQLAAGGWRVAVNYVNDEEAASATVAEIHRAGGDARAYQADTSDPRAIEKLFDTLNGDFGQVTALVNNAGVTGPVSRLDEAAPDMLQRAVEVNLLGVFHCCQSFVRRASPLYGGPGGAIVNISSVAAGLGSPGEYTWYAATKGGVDSLTIGLSKELAQEKIRVNAVSPGLIDTEIHERESRSPGRLQRLEGQIPMGRAGQADEVAAAVVWLLSDAASYITGANLKVSGGR